MLFFDDLAVGQKHLSGTHTVDAEQIKAFATQFDPQPFHTDEAKAATTFFGGLAASGWHTAALTMKLMVETGPPFAGGIVGAGGDIAWPLPTRPGDTLQVESEIVELVPSKSKPDRGMARVLCTTRNQNGEAVQLFTAKLVIPRKPAV